MSDDPGSTLFRCDRFLGMFPGGMPVRACIRRQDERREVLDGKGNLLRLDLVHPFCAEECELGRANRAALPAPAAEEPRAAREKRPPSSRLWTGEVPDVPIAPPPATSEFTGYRPERVGDFATDPRLAAAAAARARAVAAGFVAPGARPTPVTTPAPTAPAQPAAPTEKPMPAHPPCPKCKSSGRHRNDCPRLAEIRGGSGGKVVSEKLKTSGPVEFRTARPRAKAPAARRTVAEVVAAIAEHQDAIRQHEVELVGLRSELRDMRDEIAEALGEPKANAA